MTSNATCLNCRRYTPAPFKHSFSTELEQTKNQSWQPPNTGWIVTPTSTLAPGLKGTTFCSGDCLFSYLFSHNLLSTKEPDLALHFFKRTDEQRPYRKQQQQQPQQQMSADETTWNGGTANVTNLIGAGAANASSGATSSSAAWGGGASCCCPSSASASGPAAMPTTSSSSGGSSGLAAEAAAGAGTQVEAGAQPLDSGTSPPARSQLSEEMREAAARQSLSPDAGGVLV